MIESTLFGTSNIISYFHSCGNNHRGNSDLFKKKTYDRSIENCHGGTKNYRRNAQSCRNCGESNCTYGWWRKVGVIYEYTIRYFFRLLTSILTILNTSILILIRLTFGNKTNQRNVLVRFLRNNKIYTRFLKSFVQETKTSAGLIKVT